jgi:cytochrome o ubiquinol oxidase subunit 1
MPLYALGLKGATRRMQHYANLSWQPLMHLALGGALLILVGIALTVVQLVVSIRQKDKNRDVTGDPWNGRTLEWSVSSPPPAWNFAVLPRVQRTDAYWFQKQDRAEMKREFAQRSYEAFAVPKNTPVGFFVAFFTAALGFALIWRIWWLAIIGFLGAMAVCLLQAWRIDGEVQVPAEEIAVIEREFALKANLV